MPGVHSGIPGISDRYIQWYSRYQCQIHTKVSKVSVSGTHSGIQGISVRYTAQCMVFKVSVSSTHSGIQGISFKYTLQIGAFVFRKLLISTYFVCFLSFFQLNCSFSKIVCSVKNYQIFIKFVLLKRIVFSKVCSKNSVVLYIMIVIFQVRLY